MGQIIIERLAKIATKQFLAWLVVEVKWLAWGPLPTVLALVLEPILVKIFEFTYLRAVILYIYMDVRTDTNAVEKILREIGLYDGPIPPEKLSEFDERLAKAGRELIRFGSIG